MSSEAITRTDLTNILNEVLPTTRIGSIYSATDSKAITTAGIDTHTSGAHITVPAGVYAISAQWQFNSRSSTGATNSQIHIWDNTHSEALVYERVTAANNAYNILSCSAVASFSEETTLYVRASTSITYTTATANYIKAVQIIDANATSNQADYIVEQGTSGIWTYRKWNSGIAECWGTHSWTISSWTQWGSSGIFYSSYSGQQAYPTSLFTSAPTVTTGNVLSNGDTWFGTRNNESSTNAPEFFLLRVSAGSNNVQGRVHIHAKGRWK